jgi:hypothetical protein
MNFFDTRQMRYKTLTAGPFPLRYHAERAASQTIYSATQTTTGVTNRSLPPSTGTSFWSQLMQGMKSDKTAKITGSTEVQVFFAPSASAQKIFTLKPGTPVTTGTTHENWISISAQDGMGWIPASAIAP